MIEGKRKSLVVLSALVLLASPLAALNTAAVLDNAAALANQLSPGTLSAPAPVAAFKVQSANTAQALPNFAKVSEALFRSGQPTQQGVARLKSDNVRTILKLDSQDPQESSWADAEGIRLEPLLMPSNASPSYEQIDQALAFINNTANQPVDVHCHYGKDRTGAVVAAYRVTVQGMSVDQAAAEAKSFGYGAPGFQDITTFLNGYVAYKAGH
jgi:protein tyrosine/serine phosphatase